jgi:hypothetical protein
VQLQGELQATRVVEHPVLRAGRHAGGGGGVAGPAGICGRVLAATQPQPPLGKRAHGAACPRATAPEPRTCMPPITVYQKAPLTVPFSKPSDGLVLRHMAGWLYEYTSARKRGSGSMVVGQGETNPWERGGEGEGQEGHAAQLDGSAGRRQRALASVLRARVSRWRLEPRPSSL